jgi:hypothetical protein
VAKTRAQGGPPNLCAHLVLICAILPFALVLLLLVVDATNPELVGKCRTVCRVLVPLITLVGAVCGLIGARCFWRDTRRGGIVMIAVGLLGCGLWVLCYESVVSFVMGLFPSS